MPPGRLLALGGLTALLWVLLTPSCPAYAAADGRLVDAVLASVDGEIITASDVALARALGLFGLSSSSDPIDRREVQRLIRATVVLVEARRLAIDVPPEAVEQVWRAATQRGGGRLGLDTWLLASGVDRAWAQRAITDHVRWRRFIELRFEALVFVTPDEIAAAVGSESDDAGARARTHERLRTVKAERALDAWLGEREAAASIRTTLRPGERIASPFSGPGMR